MSVECSPSHMSADIELLAHRYMICSTASPLLYGVTRAAYNAYGGHVDGIVSLLHECEQIEC
jgi:hypothetical protein